MSKLWERRASCRHGLNGWTRGRCTQEGSSRYALILIGAAMSPSCAYRDADPDRALAARRSSRSTTAPTCTSAAATGEPSYSTISASKCVLSLTSPTRVDHFLLSTLTYLFALAQIHSFGNSSKKLPSQLVGSRSGALRFYCIASGQVHPPLALKHLLAEPADSGTAACS